VEIKKLVVFVGCLLGQQESALVKSASNDVGLEGLGASEEVGWLRCCYGVSGEIGGCAGANSMDANAWDWCLARWGEQLGAKSSRGPVQTSLMEYLLFVLVFLVVIELSFEEPFKLELVRSFLQYKVGTGARPSNS
jgi:hypothetical protein